MSLAVKAGACALPFASVPTVAEFAPLAANLPLAVLDPFAGSGSTLLAARMLGRAYLGIELDAGYHAAACRRLGLPVSSPAALEAQP